MTKKGLVEYEQPDQWLDWGGHTVQVYPHRNAFWIHDGQEDWHARSVERGRAYDAGDVTHFLTLLQKHTDPLPPNNCGSQRPPTL